jgi:hypothetical protein
MSRKQFENMREQEERIEKAVAHHNNFKLALLEETIKDGTYSVVSKMYSNLKLNQHVERGSENSSKELRRRSDSLSKPKKMELITVKMR